ncbi:MAG: ABC transporter permease [Candidatus Doudnabacteria bacterium]|nr:ABC transporter permease [Candidatus Doudnabacteria bacterium]
MNSFIELFKANLKMFLREKEGFFWTVLMPAFIYIALSVLPIGKFSGAQIKYSNYVLPGIIAMTIMQGGIYGLAYWMVDLKSRGIIKRLMATPIKQWQLALSLISARLIVVIAQTIILTLLGIFVFKADFAGNIISTIILVLLGGAIFLCVGLIISSFAKSYDTAAPITSAVGLPLTFLGNIFYPVDSLPGALQTFAKLLPITYLADGLRQAYLFPFNFNKIGFDILILTVWLIAILFITVKVFKLKE